VNDLTNKGKTTTNKKAIVWIGGLKPNIKYILPILILLLAICLIIVFAALNTIQRTETTVEQKWITSWITSPVCNTPCWENISPNKTSINDVPELLSLNPEFTNITEPESMLPSGKRCVFWSSQYRQGVPIGVGRICTNSTTDQLVDNIHLDLSSLSPEIRIKDIQEKFGDPSYFGISKEEQFCRPGLIYKEMGMIVILHDIDVCRKIKVTEIKTVSEIYFMDPNNPKFPRIFNPENGGTVLPWIGYTNYAPK
jgi:hypothetical protein